MTTQDLELVAQFSRERSDDAFTALVNRHLNLVYSAALRQVRSPQLAEEVSQTVFTTLARQAARLKPGTILTAWLYQVTRHTAVDVVRREARRQAREQIASEMSALNDTSADWPQIEPLLDEAMDSLEEPDRTALLLRYFENKSLREVGLALGASEDAAQKRVSRALERLREFFSNRKVAVGASGLAALVSANATQAAPAGLAAVVISGAVVAAAPLATTIAVAQTIAMTTLQKSITATLLAGIIGVGVFGAYQTRQASNLRQQVLALEDEHKQYAALTNQLQALQQERDHATNRLAALTAENATLNKQPNETLRLRGEVGRLRQENTSLGSTNALSKITADPEARKLLHDQQKIGMGGIYKDFTSAANLNTNQVDQFHELLADHIMQNVDNVTTILRDKPATERIDQIFAAEDANLRQQLKTLLGDEGVAQYDQYTRGLLAKLTAEQFGPSLSGTADEKANKSKQLALLVEQEAQAALAAAGRPADYQTVPILNLRNIASEQEAEQNLKLLSDVYDSVAAKSPYLSAEEVKKFQEFKTIALKNSRSVLSINRAVMAPISQ